ncbi:hypothetical protein LB518_03520 [Mesorhizobium sp. BR1-1-16]|uniref:hypothetical protein n=1 Tax=Mesorhizobium sp. BR1-1-16 TaxID=2876653 RepID=UPI001CCEC0ED|nr:hypothetical protein [Mesorhizobium sp. BR1-1-16]MBZ9935345.1 hypothetical protein [Mesorhizobium sp. BR1-1-16]
MRTLLIILALASAGAGLSACTTGDDSAANARAIAAFEPVNACGPGGTQDINQCPSGR